MPLLKSDVPNETLSANLLKAEEVAAQLYAAQDVDAIRPILRQIYDYLGVGFLTPEGGNTVKKDAFSIYDFESELLAQRYIDRWAFPVDRLASFIEGAGVVDQNTGNPISADEFLKILKYMIISSRKDKSLFTLRLIDKLGMVKSKPLNLAKQSLSPSTTYLDSIQVFLILHSFLSAVDAADVLSHEVIDPSKSGKLSIHKVIGPTISGKLGVVYNPVPDERTKDILAIIFAAVALYRKKLGRSGEYTAVLIYVIRDAFIALGYVITIEPKKSKTHWKHSDNETNKEITFTARVVWELGEWGAMISRWSKEILAYENCIPEPGPQKDVVVKWYDGNGFLAKNGHFQNGIDTSKTNDNGEATITFVPKTEKNPAGQGVTIEALAAIGAQVRFRGANPLRVWDHLGIGPENNYAISSLIVVRHQNPTLEIKRTINMPGCHFDNVSIPLHNSGSNELEGEGVMNATFTGNFGSGSTVSKFHVKATGAVSNTLHFEISSIVETMQVQTKTGTATIVGEGNNLYKNFVLTSDGTMTTGTTDWEENKVITAMNHDDGDKTTFIVNEKTLTGIGKDGHIDTLKMPQNFRIPSPSGRKVTFDLPAQDGASYMDEIGGIQTDYKLLLDE